jgi:hypothetical protein
VDVLEDFPGAGVIDHDGPLGENDGDADLATLGRLQALSVSHDCGGERKHGKHRGDHGGNLLKDLARS